MLAPFEVRSFRFQFPADLLTSWGMEMENLVLGWYILVTTGSVLALTLYWALQYLGTLLAPAFGMAGDRVGQRAIIAAMRAFYAVLAAAVTALAFAGALDPMYVFIIAALSGLIRPSDMGMRNALVAETMPADRLMPTMGISRATADSARIAGSLAGAGLFDHAVLRARLPVHPRGRRKTGPPRSGRDGAAVALARAEGRAGLCLGHAVLLGGDVARFPGQSDRVPAD